MHQFKKLDIWNDSMALAIQLYDATRTFPQHEQFGLSAQIRRAAISVPSNIAEGSGRNNPKEFNQFLGIASGSCSELMTQVALCVKLGFIDPKVEEGLTNSLDSIQKRIYRLQEHLRNKSR